MTAPVNGGTAPGLDFTIEIYATRDLGADASRVEALITVSAAPAGMAPAGMAAPAAPAVEVLIMDRSRSMMGQNKIHEARRAACAAIDALPDGVLFAIIAGNRTAEPVFPPSGGLAAIDAGTKVAAQRQVMNLWPEGGTEIGRWLTAANELFATGPAAGVVRHAVLYTDGKNEHETPAALDAALSACADRFVCDVRGVGSDWHYAELRHIAEMLHGDASAVLDIADLAEDFTRLMRRVQRLVVPRAYLRVEPRRRFRIAAIAQTYPVQVDLTRHQQSAGGAAADVPLGPWEQQTRRYQLSLHVDPAELPIGEEVRAARVELLTEAADGARERRADAALVVCRHATPAFRTVVPGDITRAGKERELSLVIQACVDAWLAGRPAEADGELDRAIWLARELGDARLPLLEGVAVAGPDGRARVRPDVTLGEMQRLGLESTKTAFTATVASAGNGTRRSEDAPPPGNETPPTGNETPPTGDETTPPGDATRRPGGEAGPPGGEAAQPAAGSRVCPRCGATTRAASLRFCENCGQRFDGEVPS